MRYKQKAIICACFVCRSQFRSMVTVNTVLKVVSLFVAEVISSITDWFQTKPEWANLKVLQDTELKTTDGGESKNRNMENHNNFSNANCFPFVLLPTAALCVCVWCFYNINFVV